jgi:hypothetical protein
MTERLSSLLLLLVNVIIIYICNVVFKDCPINTIEKYHLKKNSFINLIAIILPIQYNKEKENESILQFIFTIMTIIYGKILYIIIKKSIISFYTWVKTNKIKELDSLQHIKHNNIIKLEQEISKLKTIRNHQWMLENHYMKQY